MQINTSTCFCCFKIGCCVFVTYWSCLGKILGTGHCWQKYIPAQLISKVTDVDVWNCSCAASTADCWCCRELYYQNVGLVGSQRLLDSAVRDICCLLKVPAWNLGVTTTSKGLIAGPVSLVMEGGDVIDCMASGGGSCWIRVKNQVSVPCPEGHYLVWLFCTGFVVETEMCDIFTDCDVTECSRMCICFKSVWFNESKLLFSYTLWPLLWL